MTASLPRIADKDAPFTFLDCGCVVYCYTENGVQSVDIQQCGLHESAPKIEAALVELADRWERMAHNQVPPEYAGRGLHDKYLRMDNEAAGLSNCAEELRELLLLQSGNDAE